MNADNLLRGFLIVAALAGIFLLVTGLIAVMGGDKSGISQLIIGGGGLSASVLLLATGGHKIPKKNDD